MRNALKVLKLSESDQSEKELLECHRDLAMKERSRLEGQLSTSISTLRRINDKLSAYGKISIVLLQPFEEIAILTVDKNDIWETQTPGVYQARWAYYEKEHLGMVRQYFTWNEDQIIDVVTPAL